MQRKQKITKRDLRAVVSYLIDEWLKKFWPQRIKDQDDNEDAGDESDNDQKQKSAKEEAAGEF